MEVEAEWALRVREAPQPAQMSGAQKPEDFAEMKLATAGEASVQLQLHVRVVTWVQSRPQQKGTDVLLSAAHLRVRPVECLWQWRSPQ